MEDHRPWTGSQETLVWPPHLATESQANVPLPLLAQGLFERKGWGEEERIRASWGGRDLEVAQDPLISQERKHKGSLHPPIVPSPGVTKVLSPASFSLTLQILHSYL